MIIIKAIASLCPDSECVIENEDYSTIRWTKNAPETPPTQAEIDAEAIRLQAEEDAQEYARNRQYDYPDWGVQFNKIYDDGLTKWKSEMVDPVKTKWPKDNSGPV